MKTPLCWLHPSTGLFSLYILDIDYIGVVEIPKGDCVKSYSSCVSGRDSVENSHLGYTPERSSLSRNASSYLQLNQRFERSMTASISTSFLPDTAKFHFIEREFPGS
jgi:hypothetical protein